MHQVEHVVYECEIGDEGSFWGTPSLAEVEKER